MGCIWETEAPLCYGGSRCVKMYGVWPTLSNKTVCNLPQCPTACGKRTSKDVRRRGSVQYEVFELYCSSNEHRRSLALSSSLHALFSLPSSSPPSYSSGSSADDCGISLSTSCRLLSSIHRGVPSGRHQIHTTGIPASASASLNINAF